MSTANLIREAREARGLSKNALSKLVGVTRPCVTYWEQGKTHPRPALARRVERTLGLAAFALEKTNGADRKISAVR